VVEDVGLEGLAAATTDGAGLEAQVFLAERRAVVGLGQSAALQLFGGGLGQILRDELLDHAALVIHDAVDTEVQIGAVELKQLALQRLEPVNWFNHASSCH